MASRSRCSQVGGNFGSSLGPLLAAFVVLPNGQESLAWFCLAALGGMVLLGWIGRWYARQNRIVSRKTASETSHGSAAARSGWRSRC